MAARRCPYRLFAGLAGAVSNLICEADNELRPLRQVLAPNGMIMKRFRDAGKPREWSRVGRCGLWEAPVQHRGHVAGGMELATGRRCVQVEEWMLTGLRRQSEEMCPQSRPRRLVGEVRDDLVGSGVEHVNDLLPEKLLGRHLEPVGVAPDGIIQPGRRVASFSQQGGGRGGCVVAGKDLLQDLSRRARCDRVGSNEGVRVAGADNLQVEVVGGPTAAEHCVQLLP